ncbi:MAG: hypothetical protein IJ080_05990 [Oscillospiraceae bacterium]|nr:hypothetical protein [Oscillospiraceae bacterium]MBQ8979293.1 hypothetical protein [Oscillospiraceae bacterium]
MDEYDKALIFALKKWIADEINEIYDNKVYALVLGLDEDGYIGYNTEKHLKDSGSDRFDIIAWKHPRFACINDDEAVDGSYEIWSRFKGGGDLRDTYFACARAAADELVEDGIIKERFSENIPILFAD